MFPKFSYSVSILIGFGLVQLNTCTAQAAANENSNCNACHAPLTQNSNCLRCHFASPLGQNESLGLYLEAPRFNKEILSKMKPFSLAGLKKYLQNPVDRRGSKSLMFTLKSDETNRAVERFAEYIGDDTYLPETEKIDTGRTFFEKWGCGNCHSDKSKAPLLPIGSQLYNYTYFANAVKFGKVYAAFDKAPARMPHFESLTEDTLKALFSFVSMQSPIRFKEFSTFSSFSNNEQKLFQQTLQIFISNGCAHCHGLEASHSATASVFGGTPQNFILESDPTSGLKLPRSV